MKLYRNTKCTTCIDDNDPVYGYVNTERKIRSIAYWAWTGDNARPLRYPYQCGSSWILIPVPNHTGIHDATTYKL